MSRKRCVVAYATADRQFLWPVELPVEASIAQALEVARATATSTPTAEDRAPVDIPWESAAVGIFGEPRDRHDVPDDGDRIELYRPLTSDPRQRRRDRVRRQRRSGG